MNVNPEQRRTQAERTQATRDSLIAAARQLFTARGYENVGTEEIVRAAGVTRGALYHQFGDKASLLEAVYERIEAESTERVARIVLGSELHSPLEAMKAGEVARSQSGRVRGRANWIRERAAFPHRSSLPSDHLSRKGGRGCCVRTTSSS